MAAHFYWVLTAHFILAGFAIVSVLRRRKEPMAMLAWVFAIITLPFLGSLLHGLMSPSRVRRKARRRRHRVAHLIRRSKEHTVSRARKLSLIHI